MFVVMTLRLIEGRFEVALPWAGGCSASAGVMSTIAARTQNLNTRNQVLDGFIRCSFFRLPDTVRSALMHAPALDHDRFRGRRTRVAPHAAA
jgi:hypothetical protein